MYFQFVEFHTVNNFQYLLIQKNGCTSVRNVLSDLKPTLLHKRDLNKICWTVIRDPYERFVAGLDYDLRRFNMKIEDVKLDQLFSTIYEKETMIRGNAKHTAFQSMHLINTCVDWYVDLPDLDSFFKMHFNKSLFLNKNIGIIKEYFDKKEVLKYLHMEYEIYNKIKMSPYLWEWQKGKIF